MKTIDWSGKVAKDFRTRILVEPNSPILASKANRDRYTLTTQPRYAGSPHLGSQTSEDALTWNVFRTLQKVRRLEVLCSELGIGEPQAMLLWTVAPEIDGLNAELQHVVGTLIRKFDGILPGQISEPDVVMLGTEGVALIECKLAERNKPVSHLWEGSLDSVRKRLATYQQAEPNLLSKAVAQAQTAEIYQLVRIAFYASQLAKTFATIPIVVSLANETNWYLKTRRLRKSPAELWQFFVEAVQLPNLKKKAPTWQYIAKLVTRGGFDMLSHYLSTHPCL